MRFRDSTGQVVIVVGSITLLAVIIAGALYLLGAGAAWDPSQVNTAQPPRSQPVPPPWYEGVLIPDQRVFRANPTNRQVLKWLASRWLVAEEHISMIVQDSELWVQIFGLLDLQTLSSARIWVIDPSQEEGRRWEAELARQAIPHEGNAYLVREYRPGVAEKAIATRFYSTKTLGGLAIIENIRWTETAAVDGSGQIIAYQSQRYLPSITVPFAGGIPQKDRAYLTPVGHD